MGQCLITRKGGSAMSAKLLGTYTDTSYSSNDNGNNTVIKRFEIDTSYDYYLIKAEYSSSVTGKYGYSIVSRENLLSNACGIVVTYVDSSNKWLYVARGLKMDATGIIVGASYANNTCMIREIWGLKKFISRSNNKNYIFKDGKFSIEPTTNNFTNKSTYATDGYLQTNDAFSGTLLQIDNLPTSSYLFVEMQGLNGSYDSYVYTSRFYGGVKDYWVPSAVVDGTEGNGNLRKETKFVFGFPIDGYFKITKPVANNLQRYNIYRIWTEEIQL